MDDASREFMMLNSFDDEDDGASDTTVEFGESCSDSVPEDEEETEEDAHHV